MSTPNVVVQLKYVLNTYKSGDKKSEKYLKDQKFYNSSGEKNYIDYIIEGKKKTLDYVEYVDNKEKTIGIFNDNGYLSKEDVNSLREKLRETKSPIWHGVISFEEKFGHEKVNSDEMAMQIMNKPFKKFLKNAGFNLSNVEWYAGLHKNTDNNHIHFSFFEKEPMFYSVDKSKGLKFHKGKIKSIWFDLFKVDIEKIVTENTSCIISERGKVIDDAYHDIRNTTNSDIVYNLVKLVEHLPREGRLSYDSVNMEKHREVIDNTVDLLIKSNEKIGASWSNLISNLRKEDEKMIRILKANKIAESEYP